MGEQPPRLHATTLVLYIAIQALATAGETASLVGGGCKGVCHERKNNGASRKERKPPLPTVPEGELASAGLSGSVRRGHRWFRPIRLPEGDEFRSGGKGAD
jgi:hypothetical protein